jgi:starch-binding outer membrane protein SusE/F
MKFKSYYLLAIAALTFTGCHGNYDDWADPQGFDAADAKTATFSATAVDPIDMAKVTDQYVKVASFSAPASVDAASTTYKILLDKTKLLDMNASGQVASADLTAAVQALYGKAPTQRDLRSVVYVYAVQSNGESLYLRSDTIDVKVSLKAPFIDSKYYLIGNMCNWDSSKMLAFSHSATNVYDDPVFTVVFETTSADNYWKIIPQNVADTGNVWSDQTTEKGVVGVTIDGDTSMSGTLVAGTAAKAGKIATPGTYKMTINMMDYTYTIEAFSPYLWVPGNPSWAPATADKLYSPNNDGTYSGFTALDGGFKLATAADWSHTCYGIGATAGTLSSTGGNLTADTGFYYLIADLNKLTYTATKITSVSIIGSVKGNWDTDVDMTYNASSKSYSVTADLNAGEFKFRMNHDWTINLGGTVDSLTGGGANLKLAEAGNYTITVYPTYDGNSHCSVTKN